MQSVFFAFVSHEQTSPPASLQRRGEITSMQNGGNVGAGFKPAPTFHLDFGERERSKITMI
jgi:hypothetical protein